MFGVTSMTETLTEINLLKAVLSMKVESIKKHEVSRMHKNCESANRARKDPMRLHSNDHL